MLSMQPIHYGLAVFILPCVRVVEGAVLKTVGPKGLARSNRVHGVVIISEKEIINEQRNKSGSYSHIFDK